MKASTKAIRFLQSLAISKGPKAGDVGHQNGRKLLIFSAYMGYYFNNGCRLMAGPDIPFPAMLMAERERNEPPAGGRSFADLGVS